ncbi:hypothetical protein Rxycam_00965 [Rubrobacter xylanophilus DSM 9941]|uniref:hypothetical protein n=1 Tax=Rubrobacter xylanophilus TaxID=49319 RepID=UPI001C640066|nr:hypothetical protein [Rubrobacter xylanophilus]QYJ15151.1 hypothetical protein Rxycam_00965 [Rubrobacter xylanophilus DSM 9941]
MASRGEERGGLSPRARRAFGCVTWVYMATLAFLAAASLLFMPFWFFGGWNVFSLLEGPAFFATLLFLPAMGLGALLGLRTRRSARRVATRAGAVLGAVVGWLGCSFVVWLEVRGEEGGGSYVFVPFAALSGVLLLYALFAGDARRARRAVGAAALLALVSGGFVLALDGSWLAVASVVVSALSGAAAGWVAGFGYARAGGKEMLPPGAGR